MSVVDTQCRLPAAFFFRVIVNSTDMFLNLYRATQSYSWYDITCEGYDEETGEYFPGSGEETTVFYQWALFPRVLQAQDGGQSSRKDGDYTETTVERVDVLPEGAELRAPNSIGTLFGDVRLWLDWHARWAQFLYRPKRYWVPIRLSSGTWLSPVFIWDLKAIGRSLSFRWYCLTH